jgi:tetratricopeptide (TPR) repeat protein
LFFDREMIGQMDESLAAGVQCIKVDPDAGPCYADLIYNYAALNRLADAKTAYQQAQAHGLDYADLHFVRYQVAFLQDDIAEMDRQAAWASGKPGSDDEMLMTQSQTEAFYGRFTKARQLSERAIESAIRNDQKESAARWQISAALRDALVGNISQARQETAMALRSTSSSFEYLQSVAAVTKGLTGDTHDAEIIADVLDKKYPSDTMLHAFWLPSVHAAIGINKHRPEQAIDSLIPATGFEAGEHIPMLPAYLRGQAYLAAGRGLEAAVEFQKLIDHRNLLTNSLIGALAYLGLARAQALELRAWHGTENKAAKGKAVTAYQDFLSLWKDADVDIPIFQEARGEYAKLR